VHEGVLVVVVLGLFILGGTAVIWMSVQSRRQIREMEHRERLAMIERGLVPSPEVDPGAFEERMARSRVKETPGSVRSRTAGIMMIGLGLAFMFMISFAAGVPSVGIGIGGAFALLGAAFFANAVMLNRSQPYVPPAPTYTPPARYQKPEPPDVPPSV
jgi:Flp pilus assembly protein TadB